MLKLKTFRQFSWNWGFLVVLMTLGVFFRFYNLEQKIYWHDEVYTSLRAAGFTSKEIGREIFQNGLVTPQDLQKFQYLKPGSTAADTVRSLAVEDPQHPPLYFLIARGWLRMFGSVIAASRTLPALLSLLSLPLMYMLGIELFASPLAALLATTLVALSPFDILFAQIARQYSLLTCAVIGSSLLLLKALRLQGVRHWGLYALATALGLYTHAFFGLTVIAQGVYVILLKLTQRSRTGGMDSRRPNAATQTPIQTLKFLLSIVAALAFYSPWLVVLISNRQRALNTTSWSSGAVDVLLLMKLWILSFTALFFDLDFGFDSVWTYLLRLPFVLLIAMAIFVICHHRARLFILTSIFVPFLLLAIPDLILGGKRSAVSRYLIPCFPAVHLAVAYFLAKILAEISNRRQWRVALAVLLTGSIASCTVSALSDTWWSNVPSYFNAEVSRRVNADPSHLLLSDVGNDETNLGDLISLSYLLHPNVRLLLLNRPPDLKLLSESRAFVFRPSATLYKALQQQGQLKLIFPPGQLWQWQR